LTGPEVIMGVYAFAFQIYGDFSGYSSIAKGIAQWMGFELMWNFKNPYFSVTPSEFWARWHISLSSWLRDYLYIPLGGSKEGKRRTLRNLVITMGLGGLWHGAGWTFILWGLYHGLLLVVYRLMGREENEFGTRRHVEFSRVKHALKMVLFFQLVCISWLLFRADSIDQVFSMVYQTFSDLTFTGFAGYGLAMTAFFAGPLMVLEYWTERSGNLLVLLEANTLVQLFVYLYLILMIIVFPPLISQEFIYFQF